MHEERLLIAWDEERRGIIHVEVSHMSINKGRTFKITWNAATIRDTEEETRAKHGRFCVWTTIESNKPRRDVGDC